METDGKFHALAALNPGIFLDVIGRSLGKVMLVVSTVGRGVT
jgi:hypothetical protein